LSGVVAVPLRKRLSLVAAAAVAVAVLLAAMVCYFVVRDELRNQVDAALQAQATVVKQTHSIRSPASDIPGIPANAGGPAPYEQLVLANHVYTLPGSLTLPVTSATMASVNGRPGTYLSDVTVGGNHLRMITIPVTLLETGQTAALELARPLAQVDTVLSNLRLILAVLLFGGIALAATLGRFAARRVLAPLAEVSAAAQTIGETDDLSLRLAVHADDEVGQLAKRFNEMLERLATSRAALDDSVRSQRQLVADASHELRTPITSLRTNIEVLLAGGELDEEDRNRLLADVVEQSEELSTLVSDLIELARGDLPSSSREETRLDRVVEEALIRARRNAPDVPFQARLARVVVFGDADRLMRAVNNLLDNAARHTAPGRPVEVVVDADGVTVRDHGSGIGEEDLPYVFDRFYRGANSRSRQGSGLGLAIVRQAAEQHGGQATAENAADGGAVFHLRLPTQPVAESGDYGEDDDLVLGPGGLVTRA
jgi:two-component system sensor histidine kinase MprB